MLDVFEFDTHPRVQVMLFSLVKYFVTRNGVSNIIQGEHKVFP